MAHRISAPIRNDQVNVGGIGYLERIGRIVSTVGENTLSNGTNQPSIEPTKLAILLEINWIGTTFGTRWNMCIAPSGS